MQMYAFFLSRGHNLDELLSLNKYEKMLYYESMLKFYEFENEKLKAICGG